ncbi:MAG: RNA-binding cell elongation regulator Jag/EloR [Endomicrobiales bacterium]|jgi:spoIIIJ-associated protein
MAEIEIEAKTVEEAIQEGLTRLGISREKVDIKILNEGTAGLFGLMGNKPARVRLVTLTGSVGTMDTALDYPLAQKEATEIVSTIIKMMEIPFSEVDVKLVTGRIIIDIKSQSSSLLIGKNGQTLDALEHIINLILSKNPATRVKATVDCNQFRMRQEETLQAMAAKVAEQVKTTGTTYRFDPMSSIERRIIHVFLKSDPEIETLSEGTGNFRRVIVKQKHST